MHSSNLKQEKQRDFFFKTNYTKQALKLSISLNKATANIKQKNILRVTVLALGLAFL